MYECSICGVKTKYEFLPNCCYDCAILCPGCLANPAHPNLELCGDCHMENIFEYLNINEEEIDG